MLVVDPAKVATVDPTTHYVTFVPNSGARDGGELFATPALGDLNGDDRPEIVVGAQEEYEEPINVGSGADVLALLGIAGATGNSRLYAISPNGTLATNPDTSAVHPNEQAYLPGWPVKLGMIQLETLPTIGDGVATQAAIGDVSAASAGPEIVAASAAGPLYVLNAQGASIYGEAGGRDVPLLWSGGLAGGQNAFVRCEPQLERPRRVDGRVRRPVDRPPRRRRDRRHHRAHRRADRGSSTSRAATSNRRTTIS